jgi:hypothetical protein
MKIVWICSLLILFGHNSLHAATHDWSEITYVYLERGHESTKNKLIYKFHITEGRAKEIEFKGSGGSGRYIAAPSAMLYDFTDKKGIMTTKEARSIVLDTVTVLTGKAHELFFLLNKAIEASANALPNAIKVTVVSKKGGEKIQITPGDHLVYKRPWKLDAKIQGKEKVTFSLTQRFGEDKEGTTFNGFISFTAVPSNIDRNESLDNWLVALGKRTFFNKKTNDREYIQIDPAGGYETIGDILELK